MSEENSTIRLTAKADIQDAVAYADAIDKTSAAILRLVDAVKQAQAVGAIGTGTGAPVVGTGGAAQGLPPPPPSGAANTPPAGTPGGAPAPPTAQGWPGGVVPPWAGLPNAPNAPSAPGGPPAPPQAGGAAVGAPPPPPDPPPGFGTSARERGRRAAQEAVNLQRETEFQRQRANQAFMDDLMRKNASEIRRMEGGDDDGGGGGSRTGKAPPSRMAQAGRAGLNFLEHATSTAIGVGLGTSLSGFLLAAPQRYLALSEAITTTSRRFREARENAAFFGAELGYTIARSAQLADALGKETNTFSRDTFRRNAGFARFTGMDPGAAMSSFGRMERVSGAPLSDANMVAILARAQQSGMDQGRLEEFVARVSDAMSGQLETSGRTNMNGALATAALPALIYGANDPRRTADMSLTGGLQATMTGSDAMRTYMLRAMGYGTERGPGYIEAKKRLDAGIYDSRNLVDLFSSFQKRGMGQGAMFRALESVAGGNLKAHQIEALVNKLGTKEGLDEFSRTANGTDDAMTAFSKQFDIEGKGGFAEAGKRHISAGESIDVRIERMMMTVGKPIAEAIPPMQSSIENIAKTLGNLTGVDWGTLIPNIAKNIEKMTEFFADVTDKSGGFGPLETSGGTRILDSSEEIGGRFAKLNFIKQNYGVKAWWGGYMALYNKGDQGLTSYMEDLEYYDVAEAMGKAGGGR